MPDSCTIALKKDENLETYILRLSSRNRKHLRKEILKIEDLLEIRIVESATIGQLEKIAELYSNVHHNNLGLNTFSFPSKLFGKMWSHPNWEFITIAPKDEPKKMIGVMLCYKNIHKTYVPAFVGMDYSYLEKYHIYRQLLFQTIKRAIGLKYHHIALGLTAGFEKRKLGASVHTTHAYLQTADNYTLELMGILESS
jgi:hypothetical protein